MLRAGDQDEVPPHPGHQQAASSVLYTTSRKHSLVFLRMGEIMARNMLSWLKLLIKLLLLHLGGCLHYCNRVRIVDNGTVRLNWRQCFVGNVGRHLPGRSLSHPRIHRFLTRPRILLFLTLVDFHTHTLFLTHVSSGFHIVFNSAP